MKRLGDIVKSALGRPDPNAVVREHAPLVYRQLRRIFGPRADVDDVFQQVFLEIVRSLPSFRGEAKLSTWIRRITWNVAYQEMRSRYAHKCLTPLEHEPSDAPERADEEVERRETMRRLYAGLERIDPKQRMPVLMHDVDGMTLKEIGELLGRPLPTVASQLYAGRAALAEILNAEAAPKKQRGVREKAEV
jgi:RNA polymerase sigma-70 factor, ECF subfamily